MLIIPVQKLFSYLFVISVAITISWCHVVTIRDVNIFHVISDVIQKKFLDDFQDISPAEPKQMRDEGTSPCHQSNRPRITYNIFDTINALINCSQPNNGAHHKSFRKFGNQDSGDEIVGKYNTKPKLRSQRNHQGISGNKTMYSNNGWSFNTNKTTPNFEEQDEVYNYMTECS